MKFMLATVASVAASVAAVSIDRLAVPETIAVDKPFAVQISSGGSVAGYVSSVMFGFGAWKGSDRSQLGVPAASIQLIDAANGIVPYGPFTRQTIVPSRIVGKLSGQTEIRAAVLSSYGANGNLGYAVYRANVTFGEEASDKYVDLQFFYQ
ncbi:hypothetical protein NLG97_g4393 [Lecanicillium saksenae]|uniref:Uncharacterized protein n=1 Tax=Lecanicillium saksenae TaxID=468837 RepID=A0ACC1QXZ6_9HYPO|nr:hypothetical protein NLG97_g4393 [Lecanicillium saksenae]